MRTTTVKLPAFLASALVNGDTSGLTCEVGEHDEQGRDLAAELHKLHKVNECDYAALAAAEKYIAPGNVVDAGEQYFSWRCDLPGFTLGCDVADYLVVYQEGK